jgi:hypothetical protein
MASEIEFWVKLAGANHDQNTGWHCSALTIPSSRVATIVIDGKTRALDDFKIGGSTIRLTGELPKPVPDAAVLISVDRKLVRFDQAVVAAVIGMIGTLGAALLTRPTAQVTPLPIPAVASAAVLGEERREPRPVVMPPPAPSAPPACDADVLLPKAGEKVRQRVKVSAGFRRPPEDRFTSYYLVDKFTKRQGDLYFYKARLTRKGLTLTGEISSLSGKKGDVKVLTILATDTTGADIVETNYTAGKQTTFTALPQSITGHSVECGAVTVVVDEE